VVAAGRLSRAAEVQKPPPKVDFIIRTLRYISEITSSLAIPQSVIVIPLNNLCRVCVRHRSCEDVLGRDTYATSAFTTNIYAWDQSVEVHELSFLYLFAGEQLVISL